MKTNKSYLLIAAVLTFLFAFPPTHMLAQENIVDRLNKALNLKLPDKYDAEARKFIEKFEITRDKNVIAFTEKFLVEQMKEDLGVNKQDQYLFLLSVCFNELTNEFLYCGEDGNEKRLESCNAVWDKLEQIQNKYSDEFLVYLEQLRAEARQQSIDKGLEALTGIINGFEKYITLFQNMIHLDDATQTLANFNKEKNTLLQRAEKLRSRQQSNQHPSATEAENMKKTEEQLLSDLTNQRTAVAKQIYAVIEKNIPEIEKRISSSIQKNEEAQQQIDEAKQRFAEAQKAIADSKLTTAEDRLRSTMALLRIAKAKQRIENAKRESAEFQRQSAEAQQRNIDKGIEALTGIINGFEKYITLFQNMIHLDDATQTLANFNKEKNTLLQRAEKLRSRQQSNQHPSATEAENMKKTEEQLLSDLTNQRTAVAKQIYAVIEKNIPEIEKRISSSIQKNEEAQQQIDEAKQRFAEAQKAIADSKLTTAEDRLRSTMALLRIAEAKQRSAEAQQQSAELIVKIKEGLNQTLNTYKDIYLAANQKLNDDDERLRKLKKDLPELILLCEKYEVDYKKTLTPEMLKFYGIE